MNLPNIFTTAGPVGVGIRYGVTIVTSMLAIAGVFGLLTPQQNAEIVQKINDASAQLPALLVAVSGLVALLTPIYAMVTKSSSDKAAEVAKAVDQLVPPSQAVEIKTPIGIPDIVVEGTKK